jgi:hypothetical protein
MSRRWWGILIGLGVTVLLCGLYAWFFGFQTMMMLQTRRIARHWPIVKQVPRPLSDTSVSLAPGARLAYFGYEFEIPWDDLDPGKTRLNPNRVTLGFRSGRYLMFSRMPPRYFVNTLLDQFGKEESSRVLYGDAAMQSDYAMWRLILQTTPSSVTLFSPPKDIARNSMLILIKGVAIPESSGLFTLQTQGFRGFQWGDPHQNSGHVVADLFADDAGLEFVFLGKNKQNPEGVSQAEINRVLQTVRKTKQANTQVRPGTAVTAGGNVLPQLAPGERQQPAGAQGPLRHQVVSSQRGVRLHPVLP